MKKITRKEFLDRIHLISFFLSLPFSYSFYLLLLTFSILYKINEHENLHLRRWENQEMNGKIGVEWWILQDNFIGISHEKAHTVANHFPSDSRCSLVLLKFNIISIFSFLFFSRVLILSSHYFFDAIKNTGRERRKKTKRITWGDVKNHKSLFLCSFFYNFALEINLKFSKKCNSNSHVN